MSPAERLRQLPGIVQLTGAAAIVLIGGSLAPWYRYPPHFSGLSYVSGIELNDGEVCVFIGALVLFLMARAAKRGRMHDSGGIAALGLLACAIVAVALIRVDDAASSAAWGIWVSAAGAGGLLVTGLVLLRAGETALGPPD